MAVLTWDVAGTRFYETGVDHGVLYLPDAGGAYIDGVPWNGLTTVTESPSGAEANPQYADNMKYLNLFSAEEFGATIEAFTYPKEFNQFNGLNIDVPGVAVGQQGRRSFGFSYRTLLGNDIDGNDHSEKLHLIYGATASPSEAAYGTVNDSPEPITFSWEITTVPQYAGDDLKPTAQIVVTKSEVDPDAYQDLKDLLYGTGGTDPSLPTPVAVLALFEGAGATPTAFVAAPTYNSGTKVITIPTITGVTYYKNGVALTAGAQPAITEDTIITASPNPGYVFPPASDNDWSFDF